MAIFRNIQMNFWTDSKVVDDYTPEDRYFYLYLLTNPHTNLCGCYEISIKQMSDEIGYSKETVEKLLDRFDSIHGSITYSKTTKELLLINWSKYNWTSSEKFRKPLMKEIENVKNRKYKQYLLTIANGEECLDEQEVVVEVKEQKKKTKGFENIIEEYTTNEELINELNEYVKFRKKLKKGFTEHALALKLKKLDKLADNDKNKIEIVTQSTMNGWQDFYELKSNSMSNDSVNTSWWQDKETSKADDDLIKKALEIQRRRKKGQ